jgi:dolichol-phosphate mannosyltransferase
MSSLGTIVILIPCFNEEESLPQLVERMGAALPEIRAVSADSNIEVLLFDNGSTDETFRVMQRLASQPPFRIHHSAENLNVGGALRESLRLSRADTIVTMDADCTYDPCQIPLLLRSLSMGHDIVTGSPYHPRGRVLNVPAWRLFLSRTLSFFYRRVCPLQLWTYTSLFRAYRRTAIDRIRWESNGFLSTAEILVEASAARLAVSEVPTTLSVRRFGVSKIRTAQVVRDHLRYVFSVAVRRARGKLRAPRAMAPLHPQPTASAGRKTRHD